MFYNDYSQGIINFFKVIGVCPFLDAYQSRFEPLLVLLSFINVGMLTTITYFVAYYKDNVFYDSNTIILITQAIQIGAPFFAHYVIIFEALHSRSKRYIIWQSFKKIDISLATFPPPDQAELYTNSIHRFLKKFISVQLVCLFFDGYVMISVYKISDWSYHLYATFYTYIVCRSVHLFYAWLVDLVSFRMEAIGEELQRLHWLRPKEQLKRLTLLKAAYLDLWHITNLMDDSFGWSELTNVGYNFICSAVNLYWNFMSFYYGTNIYATETLFSTVPPFVATAVMCYSCDACHKAVCVCFILIFL